MFLVGCRQIPQQKTELPLNEIITDEPPVPFWEIPSPYNVIFQKKTIEVAYGRLSERSSFSEVPSFLIDSIRRYEDNLPSVGLIVSGKDDLNVSSDDEASFTIDTVIHFGKYLSLSYSWFFYEGGTAHPLSGIIYNVFDMETGALVRLQDLVPDTVQLKKIAFDNLKKQHPDIFSNSTENDGLSAPFFLPDNFSVTPDGIVLTYQRYDIAPYSYGIVNVKITYPDISALAYK
jgi:hypothetical protein